MNLKNVSNNEIFIKHLEKVSSNVLEVHKQFYTWQTFQKGNPQDFIAKTHFSFFNTIFDSLKQSYVIDLYKLFDPKGHNSFHFLLGEITDSVITEPIYGKIEDKADAIDKLKTWRDKFFAHEDKETIRLPEQFVAENPLTYNQIEELINFSLEILNDISTKTEDSSYHYDGYLRELKNDVNLLISVLDKRPKGVINH